MCVCETCLVEAKNVTCVSRVASEKLDSHLIPKCYKYLKDFSAPIVMQDKGVLLHRQQRHPLTSHRLLSYSETVYISVYLSLEAEDCHSYTD